MSWTKTLFTRLGSPWLWAGLWVITVLALIVVWRLSTNYRSVAEHAYAHPAIAKTVTRHHWHERTVLGPERIKTVEVIRYLPGGTTEIYHSTTTTRATSVVDTSSVTVSSATSETPVPVPGLAISSAAVHSRWYAVLGWHPGTGIASVLYVPPTLPFTASVGITTEVTPYVAVGVKLR